jgi:exosome complex component RRP41
MKMGGEHKILLIDGKRLDDRDFGDLRPIEMNLDIVPRANGSARVRFGSTITAASVYGPREVFPRHMQQSDQGTLKVRYAMAPFSVEDRKNPGPDRRSTEISKVARLALTPTIFLEEFPKAGIEVYIEVLQADGSTRVTGLNAASLALADAGIPMRDLVAACSVGKIEGRIAVDLCGDEDKAGEADVAVAMMPGKGLITLLQMDGLLTRQELKEVLRLAKDACKKIYESQKIILKEKYRKVD